MLAANLNSTPCYPVLSSVAMGIYEHREAKKYERRRRLEGGETKRRGIELAGGGTTGLETATGIEGTDPAEAQEVIESLFTRRNKEKKEKSARKSKKDVIRQALATLAVPDEPAPSFLPSGDLLEAIHAHASAAYSTQNLLLPTLTAASPFRPESALSLMDSIESQYQALEDAAFDSSIAPPRPSSPVSIRGSADHDTEAERQGSRPPEVESVLPPIVDHKERKNGDKAQRRRKFAKLQKSWLPEKAGSRAGVWVDVERAYDSSALVAIGVLLDLVAAHELGDPALSTNNSHYTAANSPFEIYDSDSDDLPDLRPSKRARTSGPMRSISTGRSPEANSSEVELHHSKLRRSLSASLASGAASPYEGMDIDPVLFSEGLGNEDVAIEAAREGVFDLAPPQVVWNDEDDGL